jgi:hypothetical protein
MEIWKYFLASAELIQRQLSLMAEPDARRRARSWWFPTLTGMTQPSLLEIVIPGTIKVPHPPERDVPPAILTSFAGSVR